MGSYLDKFKFVARIISKIQRKTIVTYFGLLISKITLGYMPIFLLYKARNNDTLLSSVQIPNSGLEIIIAIIIILILESLVSSFAVKYGYRIWKNSTSQMQEMLVELSKQIREESDHNKIGFLKEKNQNMVTKKWSFQFGGFVLNLLNSIVEGGHLLLLTIALIVASSTSPLLLFALITFIGVWIYFTGPLVARSWFDATSVTSSKTDLKSEGDEFSNFKSLDTFYLIRSFENSLKVIIYIVCFAVVWVLTSEGKMSISLTTAVLLIYGLRIVVAAISRFFAEAQNSARRYTYVSKLYELFSLQEGIKTEPSNSVYNQFFTKDDVTSVFCNAGGKNEVVFYSTLPNLEVDRLMKYIAIIDDVDFLGYKNIAADSVVIIQSDKNNRGDKSNSLQISSMLEKDKNISGIPLQLSDIVEVLQTTFKQTELIVLSLNGINNARLVKEIETWAQENNIKLLLLMYVSAEPVKSNCIRADKNVPEYFVSRESKGNLAIKPILI